MLSSLRMTVLVSACRLAAPAIAWRSRISVLPSRRGLPAIPNTFNLGFVFDVVCFDEVIKSFPKFPLNRDKLSIPLSKKGDKVVISALALCAT